MKRADLGDCLDRAGKLQTLDLAQFRDIPEADGSVETRCYRYRVTVQGHRRQGRNATSVAHQRSTGLIVGASHTYDVINAGGEQVWAWSGPGLARSRRRYD